MLRNTVLGAKFFLEILLTGEVLVFLYVCVIKKIQTKQGYIMLIDDLV